MTSLHNLAAAAAAALISIGFPTMISAQVAAQAPVSSGFPAVPTTKIIAIGRINPNWTPEAFRTVMPQEVHDTVNLYLAGKIEQWFVRRDRPGVVFIFNMTDVREVEELLEKLPLGQSNLMDFEVIPLGPLAPLGLLLNRVPQ